jgi:hypothetical protein
VASKKALPAHQTVVGRLRRLDPYLSQFGNQGAVCFEELVVQSLACALHVPFYNECTDDSRVPQRVTWNAARAGGRPAGAGKPDGVARAHSFTLVIEATLKTGALQWAQEFAQCVRHLEDMVKAEKLAAREAYALLVARSLHRDTYRSVHTSSGGERWQVVPLETDALAEVVETSMLAFTIRHVDVRALLLKLIDLCRSTPSLDTYRDRASRAISDWRLRVMENEKDAFIGLKAYEAMLREGRTHVGESDILVYLRRQRSVKQYLRMIAYPLGTDVVGKCVLSQGLGILLERNPTTGERILGAVPGADFCARARRYMRRVERASA